MALNVDKLKQTNTVSTPVTTSTDTTARTNKKPIDFNYKNGDKTETDKDILTSINSKEYKGLKNESEKIEWLRQNNPSLKNATDKDIKNYILLAEQTKENDNTSTTTSLKQEQKVETEQIPSDTEATDDIEIDETATPATRQFNKKTTEYLQSIKYEGDVESYIQEISGKELAELTDKEKSILQEYKAVNLPPTTKSAQKKELFNVDTLLSPNFTKLKPEQKLKELSKIYLNANDSKYSELSKKDKERYEKDTVAILKQLINYNEKNKLNNFTSSLNAVAILQYAHATGKSIEDLTKLKKENINKIIDASVENIVNTTLEKIKNIPGNSNVEKVNKFADAILMGADSEYEKLSGKAKDEYRNSKIKEFFNNIGIPVETIAKNTHMNDEELFKNGLEIVSNLSKSGKLMKLFKAFQSENPDRKLEAFGEVLKSLPDDMKKRYQTSIEIMQISIEVGISLNKENPTSYDMYKYLQNKQPLSAVEKNMLEMYSRLEQNGIDLKKDNIDLKLVNEVAAEMYGMSTEEYITTMINNIDFKTKEGRKQFVALIGSARAMGNAEQLELIETLLNGRKDLDPKIRDKYIKEFLNSETYTKTGFAAMIVHDNGAQAARATNRVNKQDPKMAEKMSRMMPACAKSDKAWNQFTEGIQHHKNLMTASAQGLNDLEDRTKANRFALSLANNSNIADSYKSQFTKDLITDAARLGSEEQLRYGKTLSTVDNPAVTEGLAAASKSISDPGARQQYDSYVDNAMKNYPPEQQAAIRQARETGEISSSTLSQTNTSNGKPIESSNSNSGSNAGSNVAANSNSANGTGTTSTPSAANNTGSNNASQPSGVTSASSNQSQGSALNQTAIYTTSQTAKNSVTGQAAVSNNRTVYASASGSPTASVSASKTHISNNPSAINDESAESAEVTSKTLPTISPEETQKLKDEAQVLMDKIEKFMETQAESIQEYEEQQAQKLEDRFEDIIAELTSETEVYADPNIAKYENLPQELKEDVKEYFKDLYEKNGINAIYNALDGNKKDSFVEKLASSKSHEAIMAFANEHRSDKSIIRTLFKYSQNSELIRFMDSSDIIDLYMKGQIQDINLIKNNSEALAKIIELQLKGGEEPRNLKGLYSLLTAEYQSDILANYPTLAEEIPGTDAHYAKYIQSMKTAPSANPNPAITQVKPDSGMITLENAIEGDETAHPYIYDKGDGHSVTLPFGRDYDRQKKKGHIYFA